jgi:4-coumarate--CoA ligase
MGCNPSYTSIELEHLYGSAKTRWVIVEADLLDNIMPALMAHRIPASSVLIFDAAEGSTQSAGFKSWTTLLQSGEQDWIRFNDRETSTTTRAALLSTSGTTGLPKLAALSHYAHVSAGVAMSHMDKKPYEVSRLIAIPQFHAFAAPLGHTSPIRSGIKTYIMRRFRLGEFARYVERHKITETAVVPPMISSLVGSEIPSTMLQSLRMIRCAGSSLYDSTRDAMYRRLHADAIVSQVWGMTELGWISSFEWPEKDTSGSVGRLLPLMEARYVKPRIFDST